jgi:hypothetical protein
MHLQRSRISSGAIEFIAVWFELRSPHASSLARACARLSDTRGGKEQCHFSDSVFVLPQNGCSRQSHHFYKSDKVNRINAIGASMKTVALDNVGFQAVWYKTVLQRSPWIVRTIFGGSLTLSID